MYKIILVDDDFLVLEFLTHMIPWRELGFSIVGSFQDGAQALEHVKSEMPDVIITDIGMPIMNGIELLRNIKELDSTCYSIILSCHDDFQYAQQALKLKTFDYLLKESMESDMMIDLLKSLKGKLDKEKRTDFKKNQMESLIKENLIVLKSRFLHAVIEGKTMLWEQQGNELGLDLSFLKCSPVLCFIDRYEETKEAFISDELLKFSIDNIVSEILNKTGKSFSIFYKESMFFIFYPHESNMEIDQFQVMQKSLSEIQNRLKDYLEISISTITGNDCKLTSELVKQLKMMINTSDQRFYMKNGSIGRMEQLNFSSENIFACYMEAMQELKSLIMQEDVDGLEKSIQKWMSYIEKNRYHPNVVREWIMKIVLEIKLKFNSLQNFESTFSVSVTDNLIANVETVYQLEEALKKSFMKLVQSMKYIKELPKRNEILKAQKYVLMNLDKKITLGDVAEYLHLNPSYFSRLYKQNTNENFIDFVTKSKMEKAKEIIDNSNETIEKISEMLGFDSKSYFLKTFKKYFGFPPKDYKYHSLKGSGSKMIDNIIS
ncbi:MAG: response regulator transcription factor [Bacillota bacterium]